MPNNTKAKLFRNWNAMLIVSLLVFFQVYNIYQASRSIDVNVENRTHLDALQVKILQLNANIDSMNVIIKKDSIRLTQTINNNIRYVQNFYNDTLISNDSISFYISKSIKRKRESLLRLHSRGE